MSGGAAAVMWLHRDLQLADSKAAAIGRPAVCRFVPNPETERIGALSWRGLPTA